MPIIINKPLKLNGERVWRTYIGGREIGYLHGDVNAVDDYFPEEWMFSVTQARNIGREEIEEGICKLADDSQISLKQLIKQYPMEMLGEKHIQLWGQSTGVLIKIIDSLERLTIQVHPDKEKARKLFNSQFGKTECWHILGTRSDIEGTPCIYLGFKEGITRERWIESFEKQDYDAMLKLLHQIPVKPGDTYLVKGGIPHAIGSGCTIIEIQEPTDYTIRIERVTPSGLVIDDYMCHQGLGYEMMFDCFEYEGLGISETKNKYFLEAIKEISEVGKEQKIVGYEDTLCFQIKQLEIEHSCQMKGDGIFYCLYVLAGEGVLKTSANEYDLAVNDQFFVPASSEPFSISCTSDKSVCILLMRGPQC